MKASKSPKDDDPKKPVRSNLATRAIRSYLPLPLPAAQLVASTITRDNKFGFDDVDEDMRNEIIRSVINARKRTGRNRGGTQYEDYSQEISKDINSLKVNLGSAVAGAVTADDFRAATTFGRVSYDYDPKTDTYKVYDSYDFSKTPSKSSAYSKARAVAGKIGVQEGSPNLIGTFKGSDFKDIEGGKDYTDIKKRREAAKNNSSEAVKKAQSRRFSPLTKFKEGGKVFKPHKMHKNGKSVMARTMAEHLKLQKKGYKH